MSVRMLQRALRDQQPVLSPPDDHHSDSDDDAPNHAVANSFHLLGSPDEAEDIEPNEVVPLETSIIVSQVSVSKSKKKKKKKGKVKAVALETKSEDVDQLLERLSFRMGEGASSSTSNVPIQMESRWSSDAKSAVVLTIDTKYLRAEDELKRIFGSKVINAVERGSGNSFAGMRRRQGAPRRLGRGNVLRKTILVTPLEYWPRWDGSISMEHTDTKDGLQYFKYTFSSSYMETQKKFEVSGASYDPNTIAMLLAQHPYHLESLLALAEVYKQLGEYQQSVECLERCIFALECAWHPLFFPFDCTCRLPFSCDTNKPFFFALLKHMQHLGRRGCHRSALEVCKLLLSLDADDPLGALFSIDYFALRAEQFKWLEIFAECYSIDSSLALLPNFSFSLAVARFHLENQHKRQSSTVIPTVHIEREAVSSHALLKQALMLHPATLQKIVDKAPIKEDTEWRRIMKHPHFKRATSGGPSLEHLINLYVERNYLIWRVPDLQMWLKSTAAAVAEDADKDSGEVANWACVRQEAFQSESNEYRHLHLSEFSDSTPTIPPEELQQMMFHGNGENMGGGNALAEDGDQGQEHAVALQGRNALLVFLQSLLPWTDYGTNMHAQDIEQLVAPEEFNTDDE